MIRCSCKIFSANKQICLLFFAKSSGQVFAAETFFHNSMFLQQKKLPKRNPRKPQVYKTLFNWTVHPEMPEYKGVQRQRSYCAGESC